MSIILRENEKIIKSMREHGVFLLPRIIFWLIVFVLIVLWHISGGFDFYGYYGYVIGGSALLGGILVVLKTFRWYCTQLILTNQRLVCRIQDGLLSKKTVEILYRDIKELSFSKKGLGGVLFNYGNLMLSTSADTVNTFEHIPEPDQVVALISNIR